jgi:hypothetical protein
MTFSYEDLLSIQEIIAEVLVEVDDKEQQKLTPGHYRRSVKLAMDELSFDAAFVEVTRDFEMPFDLKLPIPKGVFNIENIWIFTGTPDDVGYQENVYWKRFFETRGKLLDEDTGYTAINKEGNITDPFVKSPTLAEGRYFFNTHSGIIHLSDSCDVFDYVRITFKGVASATLDIDKIKMVPPFARKAVTLWCVEKAARALKPLDTWRDRKYRGIQVDAAGQLDEYGFNGAWHEAKTRLRDLDKKKWRDLIEYNSKMTY